MICKSDYRDMILSHPGNTLKKWKLRNMTKEELKNHWESLIQNTNYTEDDTLLYSDHENDYENDLENNTDDIRDNDDNDDDYNNDNNDDQLYDNDEEDDTITYDEMLKEVTKYKKYFRNKIKNKKTLDLDTLLNDINMKLCDLLDSCISCTKKQETEIFKDFEEFMSRYID